VCLAQVGLVNAVHFGEFDTPFFEGSCCFLIVRSKRLTVPAPSAEDNELQQETEKRNERIPRRKEFNKNKLLRVDYRLDVGRSQVDDVGGRIGEDKSSEGKREDRGYDRWYAHPMAGESVKRKRC
jgi:hypothetical protein